MNTVARHRRLLTKQFNIYLCIVRVEEMETMTVQDFSLTLWMVGRRRKGLKKIRIGGVAVEKCRKDWRDREKYTHTAETSTTSL